MRLWIDQAAKPIVTDGPAGLLGDEPPLHPFMTAFHGVTLTNSYGKTSGYRWFMNDCVNFQKSLRLALENRQRDGLMDVDFSSVVFWYSEPKAAVAGFEPLKADALKVAGFRYPGTVEIEGNVLGDGWGNILNQKYEKTEFSGEAAASIQADQPVSIRISAPKAGKYLLKLRTHPRRSFGTIEVSDSEGRPIGTVHYRRATENSIYPVGAVELKAGETTLRVRCAHSQATVLDCWALEPVGG
jgi:hypothetical protein